MTKLEEVALAISGSGVTSKASLRKARAAIEAMRVPNDAMLAAGRDAPYPGRAYRVMIEAALTEAQS